MEASVFGLSNGDGRRSLLAAARLGPKVGGRLHAVLHSFITMVELPQWLCHNDSAINIILG